MELTSFHGILVLGKHKQYFEASIIILFKVLMTMGRLSELIFYFILSLWEIVWEVFYMI